MAEQANSAGSHLMKLDSDAPFWGDACDRSLSILLVNDLATKPEAPVNPTNHRQHCHQTAHSGTLQIRETLLQETLTVLDIYNYRFVRADWQNKSTVVS